MFVCPCKISNRYSNGFIFIDSGFILLDGDTGMRNVYTVDMGECR